VTSIGTLSAATSEAALGVEESGGTFYIGVHSTAARASGESTLYVWDRATCAELARWELPAVDPGNPFLTSVSSGGRPLEEAAFVYLSGRGELLAGVNPTDCLPPQVRADPLPPWVETTSFTVTWSGEDVWSGIASYDVQFRDGYEGAWTDWRMGTTATSASLTGVHGHTYFFRARGRDVGGIQGAYGDEEWGQAFTTVLTTPAPVLVTSRKSATPWLFRPDQTIAYTVVISNTGSQSGSVALTDTPPPGLVLLTETLMASSDPPPTYESGQIHWNGMVGEGLEVRVTYTLSPTAATPLALPLTNTAEITGSVLGPVARHETVVRAYVRWLPVVARTWEP
jgi:uncharacterized repeat protein (TIGR01451 family)